MDSKQVTLDSGVYEVHRLKMRDVAKIMSEGDMDGMKLAEVAIWKDGAPMGDAALDLYFDEFTALMGVVNELNGLGGEEGND